MFKPVFAVWETPYFCNYRCRYCINQNKTSKEFKDYLRNKENIKFFLKVAGILKDIDILWVSFAGGEPTLFSDNLADLFLFLHEYNIGYGITTNWSIKPPEKIIKYASSVNLSFDCIKKDYTLSRKNNCKKLLGYIKECKDINSKIIFNVTAVLSRENIGTIIDTLGWLKSTGEIKFVFIQPVSIPEYLPDARQVSIVRNKVDTGGIIYHDFSNLNSLLGYYFEPEKHVLRKDCGMFFSELRIGSLISGARHDVDFLLKPCGYDDFENITSEYEISCRDFQYNSRMYKTRLRNFYNRFSKVIINSGGFYASCNWRCCCGPEMVLNEVFWKKRKLAMLTSDSKLRKEIELRLEENRNFFKEIKNQSEINGTEENNAKLLLFRAALRETVIQA